MGGGQLHSTIRLANLLLISLLLIKLVAQLLILY